MLPADFYALPVIRVPPFTEIIYGRREDGLTFPELGYGIPNAPTQGNMNSQSRAEVRIVAELTYNRGNQWQRTDWSLASIWFDDVPIMALRNRIPLLQSEDGLIPTNLITDYEMYLGMLNFLLGLFESEVTFNQLDPGIDIGIGSLGEAYANRVEVLPTQVQRFSRPQFTDDEFSAAIDFNLNAKLF